MREFLAWQGWDYLQLLAAFGGLVAASAFVIRYYVEAGKDAWHNPFGRFLFKRKSVLTVLFTYVILGRVLPGDYVTPERWPGQDFSLFVILAWFAYQTWTPYRLLVDAQKAHEKEEATP